MTRFNLPPFPTVAVRLMQMVAQDDISFNLMADLVKTDAAMAATILKAANSPLWAGAEVTSVSQALMQLGLTRVSLLVLTSALWRMVPGATARLHTRGLWRHNLACALLCKRLAPPEMIEECCYMAGLMHSVGQLALFESDPIRYRDLLSTEFAPGADLRQAERDIYGWDHCAIGGALLAEWQIPAEMVDSAAHHHDPLEASYPLCDVVHVSCQTVNAWGLTAGSGTHTLINELPERIRLLAEDEALCLTITEKADALEASLNSLR